MSAHTAAPQRAIAVESAEVSAQGEQISPSAATLTSADSTVIARCGDVVCADSWFNSVRLENSAGMTTLSLFFQFFLFFLILKDKMCKVS